jgi:hypothetical protein
MIQVDPNNFATLAKEVIKVDPEFKKALKKRLKTAAQPVVEEVKRAALAIPSKGGDVVASRKKKGENLGLRASLANATVSDINPTKKGAIVKIKVSTSKFMAASGRPRSITYYIEGRRKRPWKHPVFADAGVMHGEWKGDWVIQDPHPFLAVTILPHKTEFARQVTQALDDALKDSGLLNP